LTAGAKASTIRARMISKRTLCLYVLIALALVLFYPGSASADDPYAPDQLMLHLSPDAYSKLKPNPQPIDTGIPELDWYNANLGVTKFEPVDPHGTVYFHWYLVTFNAATVPEAEMTYGYLSPSIVTSTERVYLINICNTLVCDPVDPPAPPPVTPIDEPPPPPTPVAPTPPAEDARINDPLAKQSDPPSAEAMSPAVVPPAADASRSATCVTAQARLAWLQRVVPALRAKRSLARSHPARRRYERLLRKRELQLRQSYVAVPVRC
jgi:hypothetical protein